MVIFSTMFLIFVPINILGRVLGFLFFLIIYFITLVYIYFVELGEYEFKRKQQLRASKK